MRISQKELEEIVLWARAGSRRVKVKFKGYRYMVSISRYVEALDPSGRVIAWTTAFGSRSPQDVLSSLPVESIIVEEGEQKTFTTLEDLLKYAKIRH
ncbi:MAG: hypothetical protein NZ954_01110 [Thermofilaceae archaeon]|nr:hypothetical protein [Thermofilaceae archaeon]MCX8180531.1 hypothetical protein [Thermofilaceae archaeon]MDW8003273.1 hypothetical protein [Thermofilaceae archaeon]